MRYTLDEFIKDVFRIAQNRGYTIETNRRNNLPQIDFGLKKLHLDHIKKIYPDVFLKNANISNLIENVAPGRSCSHRPFKKIIEQIHKDKLRIIDFSALD